MPVCVEIFFPGVNSQEGNFAEDTKREPGKVKADRGWARKGAAGFVGVRQQELSFGKGAEQSSQGTQLRFSAPTALRGRRVGGREERSKRSCKPWAALCANFHRGWEQTSWGIVAKGSWLTPVAGR